jgi:dTDP-4-dehydrorhamnose reductase
MRIFIIGANGQLGTDLVKSLKIKHKVTGFTHKTLEISDYNSCLQLKKANPDVVINTAAFHKTDQCEDQPEKAFKVNGVGSKNISLITKDIDAITVYISTDFIFNGEKKEPYTEEDHPSPINTYGISKLAGELYAKQNPRHYIFRIASLFGAAGSSGKGGNFVETMITKAKTGQPIKVVNDMWMSPTYTKDAAIIITKILETKLPYGVYHIINDGYCTWYQFAYEIFKLVGLNPDLEPIKALQIKAKAKRPLFSALKSIKLPRYNIKIKKWQDALREYLVEKNHIN